MGILNKYLFVRAILESWLWNMVALYLFNAVQVITSLTQLETLGVVITLCMISAVPIAAALCIR